MEAIELKIGNLVMLEGIVVVIGNIGTNISIGIMNGVRTAFYVKDYTPIKLTEAWLINFGFKKYNHIYELRFSDMPNDKILLEFTNGGYMLYTYSSIIKIKTVHRLQNITFALFEKELILKA